MQSSEAIQDGSSERRARRAAKRVGLLARKSRGALSIDNRDGFMLIEPLHNRVISGERFDLSSEEVIELCSEY